MSYASSRLWVPSKADFTDGPVGATLTDTRGGINITKAANASAHGIVGMYKSVTAPYTVTAKIAFNGGVPQTGIGYYGIHLTDGTLIQSFYLGPNAAGAGTSDVSVWNFTNATTLSGTALTKGVPWLMQDIWLRVSDDGAASGTSRTWGTSRDGVNFQTFFQTGYNTFVTPTRAGFSINPYASAVSATLTHWRVQ